MDTINSRLKVLHFTIQLFELNYNLTVSLSDWNTRTTNSIFDRLNPTVDILKHGTRPVVIEIFVRSNIAIGFQHITTLLDTINTM